MKIKKNQWYIILQKDRSAEYIRDLIESYTNGLSVQENNHYMENLIEREHVILFITEISGRVSVSSENNLRIKNMSNKLKVGSVIDIWQKGDTIIHNDFFKPNKRSGLLKLL